MANTVVKKMKGVIKRVKKWVPHKSKKGHHKHKCDECGTVWEHCDTAQNDKKEHKCPKCGTVQWRKYNHGKYPDVSVSCSSFTPRPPEELMFENFLDLFGD